MSKSIKKTIHDSRLTIHEPLPQEMQQHTYSIMDEVEGSHWWFFGRRAILDSFLQGIVSKFKSEVQNLKILDVCCGTGANIESISVSGEA